MIFLHSNVTLLNFADTSPGPMRSKPHMEVFPISSAKNAYTGFRLVKTRIAKAAASKPKVMFHSAVALIIIFFATTGHTLHLLISHISSSGSRLLSQPRSQRVIYYLKVGPK